VYKFDNVKLSHRNCSWNTPMRLLQSLTRGLQALDFLSDQSEAVRLIDVAKALGIKKSNASHLLKTLVASGYAKQMKNRRYQASGKLLNRRHHHTFEEVIDCREAWKPVLEHMVRDLGECAHMAVLVKSRVWYIEKIDSPLPLKVDHPIGTLAPLHCTALGKAFLAFGHGVPEDPLGSYTPKTITSRALLEKEIATTRDRGYAVDNEEFDLGIRCVARPVFTDIGKMITAIGISGPTVRIDDSRIVEIGEVLKEITLNSHKKDGT